MRTRRRPRRLPLPRRARERGISLVEVLAAITLFALVASGTVALAVQSIRHTVQNKHATAAAMLAQQALEVLRGQDYDTIASSTASATHLGRSYTIDTTVVTDSPAPGLKDITIRVDWTGPVGSSSHEIQTIFTALR